MTITNRLSHVRPEFRATPLIIGLGLMCLSWSSVVAEEAKEDPRIKAIMGALSEKPAPEDERITDKLKVLPKKPEAPDFTLSNFEGETFTLSEHRGKLVFVHFWSIYCPHCTREISTLDQMYELYQALKEKNLAEDIEFLAINFGEDKEKIIEWAKANNVSLEPDPNGVTTILLDADKSVTKSWKVFGLPSTYVVNKKGRIVGRAIGERDWTTPAILNQIGLLPALGELPK